MLRRFSAAAALLLALGACTVGPNFDPPEWMSPASWFAKKAEPIAREPSMPVAEPIDPNWWNLFNDPQLTALERRVAGENLDVQAATARLAESRAELGVVGAAQFPTFNANGSYNRQKASDVGVFANAPNPLGANGASGNTAGGIGSRKLNAFDVYQVGFDASWEIDLWGKVRRSVESSSASVEASAEARRAILLTNLAEVARD
jgi:outer membrane protein TolC